MADETGRTQDTEETAVTTARNRKGLWGRIDEFFGITRMGSTFRIEIIAGLTTFMAMVYILMVNAGMFSLADGVSYGAAYIATAIGAVVGSMLMALFAKMPLAQAPGMGINAFIVYTLLNVLGGGSGLTYANAMFFTLIDGVIFLVLTVTGLRKKIFEAIPKAVRHAIPVGIGLFIAFIGMQNAGIIIGDPQGTLIKFTSFNVLPSAGNTFMAWDAEGGVTGMLPALIALLGVVAIAVMSKRKVKGAILWGILGSSALFFALAGIAAGCGSEGAAAFFGSITIANPFTAFKDWGTQSVGKVFVSGWDFSGYAGGNAGAVVLLISTTALSLCMIDMFDTIGTLYGACARGNLLDENGTPIHMNKMMLADAIATCAGAVAGTSTVTTFVESSSGVAAGGRTGFTALVTAVLFLAAMFLSPIAQLIPGCATAAALIWVGVLMMASIVKIDWNDPADAIVGFVTFIVMVLGYSISKGIGIGILVYILVRLCTGKVREISVPTWVIGVLFVATFLLT